MISLEQLEKYGIWVSLNVDLYRDIKEKIEILIKDDKLRKKLSKNSKLTSEKYTWNNVIDKLEKYYKEIAKYEVIK